MHDDYIYSESADIIFGMYLFGLGLKNKVNDRLTVQKSGLTEDTPNTPTICMYHMFKYIAIR